MITWFNPALIPDCQICVALHVVRHADGTCWQQETSRMNLGWEGGHKRGALLRFGDFSHPFLDKERTIVPLPHHKYITGAFLPAGLKQYIKRVTEKSQFYQRKGKTHINIESKRE